MGSFLGSLFMFVFWVVVILGVVAFFTYNKLQRLAQEVKEKTSNVGVAISTKINLINQVIDAVQNYQQGEQLVQLKISADMNQAAMIMAYQKSNNILASVQSLANRSPDLKASEQYHRLIDSVQECEANIQRMRLSVNSAVKTYNSECLSIPTVFVAKFLGFSSAPFLEFDASGAGEMTKLKEFKTDDGERLHQLMAGGVSALAGAAKGLAAGAEQAGKMIANKVKEASATTNYFYMTPGGVPQGPVSLDEIHRLRSQGTIDDKVMLAEVGSQNWRPLAGVITEVRQIQKT